MARRHTNAPVAVVRLVVLLQLPGLEIRPHMRSLPSINGAVPNCTGPMMIFSGRSQGFRARRWEEID
jgi:hypothetical protein